jgi:hypothetical protein
MSDTKLGHGPLSSWSNNGVACFAIVLPPFGINIDQFLPIVSEEKVFRVTSSRKFRTEIFSGKYIQNFINQG